MAKVWTLEITGSDDVPPGLVAVCSSRHKALDAAHEWAQLSKGSKAIKWVHHYNGHAIGLLDDRDEPHEFEPTTEPYYLTIRQWLVR
jgi:hypothetical protein